METAVMLAHVMVINHSPQILELYEMALTDEGYKVSTYLYKADIAEKARQIQPDLIVLDYVTVMGKEGWEVLYRLKSCGDTASIPVVVATTAIKLPPDLNAYLQTNRIAVLKKPFELATLFGTIREGLAQSSGPAPAYS
jgi:DNA-binding response OmpR family regulator